jgi:hypothetical protein
MPEAVHFYEKIIQHSPDAHETIDLVQAHKLIYLQNPKVASTSIRRFLAELSNKKIFGLRRYQTGEFGNPPRIRHLGLKNFYQLSIDPNTFVFSFVRNPYDRLVSAWANKFKNYPLITSAQSKRWRPVIDTYLKVRHEIDPKLPFGEGKSLSFEDFIRYSCLVADKDIEKHVALQTKLINIPGLKLGFVGKFENFQTDFMKVHEKINTPDYLIEKLKQTKNNSSRSHFSEYFSTELANEVFKSYELDFNEFGYSRKIN